MDDKKEKSMWEKLGDFIQGDYVQSKVLTPQEKEEVRRKDAELTKKLRENEGLKPGDLRFKK